VHVYAGTYAMQALHARSGSYASAVRMLIKLAGGGIQVIITHVRSVRERAHRMQRAARTHVEHRTHADVSRMPRARKIKIASKS
jgi:hypothetical protein